MDTFTTITENPVFTLNITEMVYDARIFRSHMLVPEVYYKAFKNDFPTGYPNIFQADIPGKWRNFVTGLQISRYARSQRRYASLLQEQDVIFEEKRDFAALSAGMIRLPNLRRLSILDYFAWQVDCNTFVRVGYPWYQDWSRPAFEGIAQPSRWTAARMDDHYHGEDNLQKYPWDFRGIDNVLKSALLHAPNLRELLIGCQNAELSTRVYDRLESEETIRELVPRLSLLMMDTSSRHFADRHFDSMAMILRRAHQLEELLLSKRFGLQVLVQKWSQLRVLDLAHEYTESADFEAVIRSCAGTLRELRLIHLHLYGKAWETCSRDLGPLLRLHFVAISAMSDEFASAINQDPSSFIKLHQSQNTARNFMSNVSQSDLGFVSSDICNRSMAWHKGEFMIKSRIDLASREWSWSDDMRDFA